MIRPSCEMIEELAKTYNTIPICKEIYADVITPITLLRKLAQISSQYYLLESIEGGEKWSRYSFLGFDPILHATCKDNTVTIEGNETKVIHTDKPLEVLRELLSNYKAPRLRDMPPFTGGFVGYFAYSMIGYAEPILKIKKDELNDFDLLSSPQNKANILSGSTIPMFCDLFWEATYGNKHNSYKLNFSSLYRSISSFINL